MAASRQHVTKSSDTDTAMTATRSTSGRTPAQASTLLSRNILRCHSLHGDRLLRNNAVKNPAVEDQKAKAKESNVAARDESPDIYAAPKSESEGESAEEKEGGKSGLHAPSPPAVNDGSFLESNPKQGTSTMNRNGARRSLGFGSRNTRRNIHTTSPKAASSPLNGGDDDRLHSWSQKDEAERPVKRARTMYGSSFKKPPKVEPLATKEKSPEVGFKVPASVSLETEKPFTLNSTFVRPKTIDPIPKRPMRRGRLQNEIPENSGSDLLKDFERSRKLLNKNDILGSSFKRIPDLEHVVSSNGSALSLASQSTSDSTPHLPPIFDTEPLASSSSLSSPISVSFDFFEAQESPNDETLKAPCPICLAPVSRLSLASYTNGRRLRIREQEAFCREHRCADALSIYKSRNYPIFDTEAWLDLSSTKIPCHYPYLSTILKGEIRSPHRDALAKAAKDVKTLTEYLHVGAIEIKSESCPDASLSKHTIIPGFYGSKGQSVMSSAIMSHFSRALNRAAAKDGLVKKVGVAGFVQAVLVPELGVRLIMSELGVDEQDARTVLEESAEIGVLVNGEEDDVVGEDLDEEV